MNLDLIINQAGDIAIWAPAIVGFASAAVRLLALITKLTPGDADDRALTAAGRLVVKAQLLLDRLALNPTRSSARPD